MAPLVDRRDARTTEDEMAAFIESTEENLSKPCLEVHGLKPVGTVPERACSTAVIRTVCMRWS